MRIILIRHGQTTANAQNRFQGQSDFPLSEKGKQQAIALVKPLAALSPGRLFVSDLSRSADTARPSAEALGLTPMAFNVFREYSWGMLEGLSWADIKHIDSDLHDRLQLNLRRTEIPGQEPIPVFRKRLRQGLDILLDEENPSTVALIGHGRYLNALVVEFLRLEFTGIWPFSFESAAITILETEGDRRRLLVFNEQCHLQHIG
jgi:phosphoserine phosphatase